LKKTPQKLQRWRYPSGKVRKEVIYDVDDDHFTDREYFCWYESGNLQSLSLRVSKDERQHLSWNDDGEISLREIDREEEPFNRIVCLSCGEHTLIDGIGNAGFGDAGYMYCDNGSHVFRWDANDPAYRKIVSEETFYPWMISEKQKENFEHRIKPLSDGTRFRFSNFARCAKCAQPIARPLPEVSHLLLHERTIWATPHPQFAPSVSNCVSLTDWLISPRP